MSEAPYSKILIHGLTFEMSIGIHDFEKQSKQRVIVDVDIGVSNTPSQSLEDTVDYEALSNAIQDKATSQHYDLVETLVEEIAAICLADKNALNVKVRLAKPDIIANTAFVGTEIFRIKA